MVTSTANSARTEVRPAEQNGISIGLGVFATFDIKKGADVLVLDQPPIALVEEKQLKNICSGCYDVGKGGSIDNRRPGLVKACVRCKIVSYCDKVLFFLIDHDKSGLTGDRIAKEETGKLAIHWNVLFTQSCTPESCHFPSELF